MDLRDIPIDQIEIPEVRVTSSFSDEMLAQFRLSTQAVGILQPLHCLADNGRILLVDGLHRLQEAQARGDLTVRCIVVEGTLQDALIQNLLTSGLKGRPKASEMRKVIGALEFNYGMDPVSIRKKTGLSQDYIERLMWVNRAIPAVQAALDDELISVGHAYTIARLERPDVQERVLDLCLLHRMSLDNLRHHVKLVQELLDNPAAAPPPPEPAAPPKTRCHFCRHDYDPSDLVMYPICPACAGAAWDHIRSPHPP